MKRTLANEFLELELADQGMYSGTRFDHSGLITQVFLKNKNHSFCCFERLTPDQQWSGGVGFCNEFGLLEAIGYEEAEVGEWFPKLGVGLLQKIDQEDYHFHRTYPVIPFEVEVIQEGDEITYITHPLMCRGYGAGMSKRISIDENKVLIEYELRNVGERKLVTTEYTHNFLRINDHPINPDYELFFSFPLEVARMESVYTPQLLEIGSHSISLRDKVEQEFYCQFQTLPGLMQAQWELVYKPDGIRVREICQGPLGMAAVWGAPHTISPELFVSLQVEPGECVRWSRQYSFMVVN